MAISAIGGAEIVGLTSATVALAGIVLGFLSLGRLGAAEVENLLILNHIIDGFVMLSKKIRIWLCM